MRRAIVINKSIYGYDAHCPTLPGCHSQGKTKKEALADIKDAIRVHLAMVRKETKGLRTRSVLVSS